MTLSMAEKARSTSSVGDNRAHSDRRSGKNECSDDEGIGARDRGPKKRLLCNGGKQGEELLHLQGIWAYGLSLQKPGKN